MEKKAFFSGKAGYKRILCGGKPRRNIKTVRRGQHPGLGDARSQTASAYAG
jgi:hypothetical protein